MEVQNFFKLVSAFDHADVYLIENQPMLVVEATNTHIPIDEFKEIFLKVQEVASEQTIQRVIFDKRKLEVFHQPSMEWYFSQWKEAMLDLGTKTHRKILPNDFSFRQSVKLGRIKIREKYPDLRTDQLDIQYAESLVEAVS